MAKEENGNIRSSFPVWFVVSMIFCGIVTTLGVGAHIIDLIYHGHFFSKLLRCSFGLVLILGIVWFFAKILFYYVTATERGLETNNIVGSDKLFLWDEIVEIRRPRFGIPVDFTYVISENKSKLRLIRSMKNYKDLIDLIKIKAPNLKRCQS